MDEFAVAIPDHVLTDLRDRLVRTRYAEPTPGPEGAAGISPHYLQELVGYWLDGFDWRAAEGHINRFSQYLANVDGVRMHVAVSPAAGEGAPVVVLLHGWPYTFVEMLPVADALPEANLVVPSLPGFAFSAITDDEYVATTPAMADAVHRLVVEQLGFDHYFVYGEDVGAPVAQWLAASRPQSVQGIHDTHAVFMPRSDLRSEEEREFYRWFDALGVMGYADRTDARHDTIAASLADSPAGLAAWIVEKFRAWSDCDGNVESRFGKDALLTTVTLYWVTDTFISAYRPHQSGIAGVRMPTIEVPATVSIQRHEHRYPRSFAERAYRDLRRFSRMPSGGHFTAAEEPQQVANDLRSLMRDAA